MIVETHCHTSEHSRCSHVAAVDLVRRACLSILYSLAKVRMGDTEEFWRTLVEAEHSLAAVAAAGPIP